MSTRSLAAVATVALCFAPALAPARADGPLRQTAAEAQAAKAADRAEILAMAGHYRVRFDMQETTPWQVGYVPLERQISGGNEVVRVVEDRPDHIALQHLLVVSAGGQTHVIKHWRQDWDYQPSRVLVYAGPGKWVWEAVPERMRAGRWSQTVYQVDDSPRYAGWGQFETQGGIRRWRSNWTWRPLARRDTIRHPVYDRYYAINRHQPTPTGWIHWQDNLKMGLKQGRLVPIVQESVLNTYERSEDFDAKAADVYWTKTQDYWARVRAAWAKAADGKGGIAIAEEAETGTVISAQLLRIGDDIAAGKTKVDAGAAEATALIERSTGRLR